MRLLFDGGAFQQGIGGGILNVAVNFLNALHDAEPSIEKLLLIDDRFGAVNEEFLGRLRFTPTLLRIDTRPPATGIGRLLSDDPAFEVRIDGRLTPFATIATGISFDIGPQADAIQICSRAARPMDVLVGSQDPRRLGFGLTKVRVINGHSSVDYPATAAIFDKAGGDPEQDFRWNDGNLRVPTPLVLTGRGGRMEVHIGPRIPYPLFDGQLDHHVARIVAMRAKRHLELLDQRLATLIEQHEIDGYFVNHFIPVAPKGARLFGWVYDVLPLSNPDFFDADAVENFLNVKAAFERSEALFCISEMSRRELLRYTSVSAEKAHTTGIGISPHIHRQPASAVEEFRRRRDLPISFYVCLATIEPRKNHVGLIHGYKALLDRHPGAPQLVIAGKPGWGFGEVFETIRQLGLTDKIIHLGDIADEEVPLLYSAAIACVYPSLREGFGLPVLEAMACGIPVVTSSNSSMEEFAAGAALFVDPASPLSIGMGMAAIIEDPARVADLVARSVAVVDRFSWARIAPPIGRIMLGAAS